MSHAHRTPPPPALLVGSLKQIEQGEPVLGCQQRRIGLSYEHAQLRNCLHVETPPVVNQCFLLTYSHSGPTARP